MICQFCRSEKPTRACSECDQEACKECTVILDRDQFRHNPKPPKFIQQTNFCFPCFERVVQPTLDEHRRIEALAKEVIVITKAYRGPVPYLKKKHELVRTKDHLDEFHAVANLKFLCAYAGYDCLFELETKWTKVRKHGYEHKEWAAWAVFGNIDRVRFKRQD